MIKHSFLADQSVFKKTDKEKREARKAKKLWIRDMKAFWGADWKKYLNYPCKLKDS